MIPNEIVFFTTNPGKVLEAETAFSTLGIKLIHIIHEFVEIQSHSQEEVLLDKVRQAQGLTERPFIVDDSGFYLNSYIGFPGVMSKFCYETIGYEGILRLLPEGFDRGASFKAVIGFFHNGKTLVFDGICNGSVPTQIQGATQPGFLYEPLFIPKDCIQTMAVMGSQERLSYSYRIRALSKLVETLKETFT